MLEFLFLLFCGWFCWLGRGGAAVCLGLLGPAGLAPPALRGAHRDAALAGAPPDLPHDAAEEDPVAEPARQRLHHLPVAARQEVVRPAEVQIMSVVEPPAK